MTVLTDRYTAELLAAQAHQIVPFMIGSKQAVSCTCLATTSGRMRPACQPIEVRGRFPAGEMIAAWRAWHAKRGVTV